MTPDADAIADCVLSTFDQLPDKRKPRPRTDGSREWVPLAACVLSKGDKLACVALGTGMKCLPSTKLPLANGAILHDWHAEVLAIRSFNRFLLDQCLLISTPPFSESPYLKTQPPSSLSEPPTHPFTLEDDVRIHMYCSEAPCGDASMELVMAAQDDATPWTSAAPTVSALSSSNEKPNAEAALRGRSNFSLLGAVRCKPSRPDAPPTLSKSCTDKLALKQATSLLSSTTSLLISPGNAYLHSLIIPSSQYVPEACERAFSRSGRLKDLGASSIQAWERGYRFQPFEIKPTSREFAWSRRSVAATEKAVASNLSAVWTPSWQETLIGGVLQGRKQLDPRGASMICRRNMWKTAAQIAAIVGAPMLVKALGRATYEEVKNAEVLKTRRKVKNDMQKSALKGWVKNTGDSAFSLTEATKP